MNRDGPYLILQDIWERSRVSDEIIESGQGVRGRFEKVRLQIWPFPVVNRLRVDRWTMQLYASGSTKRA